MISVLRLGHRRSRDARISTHCGLVARAFGAEKIIYTGEKDEKLLESINKVVENWGGPFEASYEKSWKKVLTSFDGVKVHLTIYGEPIQDTLSKIKQAEKDMLVVVGGSKVPGEVYRMVDYNVGVTQQPHSEIAALAVFLDGYQNGKELDKKFTGNKLEIEPMKKGKKICERKRNINFKN